MWGGGLFLSWQRSTYIRPCCSQLLRPRRNILWGLQPSVSISQSLTTTSFCRALLQFRTEFEIYVNKWKPSGGAPADVSSFSFSHSRWSAFGLIMLSKRNSHGAAEFTDGRTGKIVFFLLFFCCCRFSRVRWCAWLNGGVSVGATLPLCPIHLL